LGSVDSLAQERREKKEPFHPENNLGGVTMRARWMGIGFAILSSILLVGTARAQGKQITLTWTAGGVGGGWYSMAGGFAEVIRSAEPDIVIKVIPGGGTVNPALVNKKECELGWGLPFMNAAAFNGEEPFKEKLTNLRAIAGGMSMNYFHFYIAADSPLQSMDEIFGEKKPIRLALSPAGTSEEWVFQKVLEHYKTSYKELEKAGFTFFHGNYAQQASQFKDQNVDAVFTFLALPGASVTEASVGRKMRLLPFPKPLLESLAKYGITEGKIPRGTYPKAANGDQEVVTATAGSVITTHKDIPDDVVYRITRAIHENLDKVRRIHGSLETYKLEDGPTGTGIPLHPAAEKYFKEKGVLK